MLVDSRRCIEYVWEEWAALHGRDPAPILAVAHGRRTSETLREIAPELDLAAEVARLDAMEGRETRGVGPVPGAAALLASLPPERWAIVTSGSPPVARLRISLAAIPWPSILVTAADVARGKPAPDGYLQAAARLGLAPADCVVLEDAPAGVAAGRAAGMRVVAVAGTAPADAMREADWYIPRLDRLRVRIEAHGQFRLVFGGG